MFANKVRILHVGWGFRPWRVGGLIEYAEDLMEMQGARGHSVAYFFAGRQYPVLRQPRLRRWRRNRIAMYEIVNSPFCLGFESGTRQPALSLAEPHSERLFRQIVAEVRPDIIHIQELASLPSSLIEIAKGEGIPTLMTLQDYAPLCPTLKLFDYNGTINLRTIVGHDCVRCCAHAPSDFRKLILFTLAHDVNAFGSKLVRPLRWFVHRVKDGIAWLLRRERPEWLASLLVRDIALPPSESAEAFQRRRDSTLQQLNRLDLLIGQSHRVSEIYRELGVEPQRLHTLQLTLAHIDSLRPIQIDHVSGPVKFVTLNGCAAVEKGAQLVLDAVRLLNAQGMADRFQLLVYGDVLKELAAELMAERNVIYKGFYDATRLNDLLRDAHVGLMPSIWEEAYGYAGVELLAKGIPVLGNAVGGITDYVREGETGWLNHERTAAGLAQVMRAIIERPEQIVHLNANIRASHRDIVKPFSDHYAELMRIYGGLLARSSEPAAT